jgi:hypothetical protein
MKGLILSRERLDFVFYYFHLVSGCLGHTTVKKLRSRDPLRKSGIVLHLRFPLSHRFSRVDDERVPLTPAEIDASRETRQASPDDDDLSQTGHVEGSELWRRVNTGKSLDEVPRG